MLSFWEQQSMLQYDFIIVGGGIVGLSTACFIKEQRPEASVLVLERGVFPSGASTKNAGFACFGSPTELLSDLKLMPPAEVQSLVQLRWNGLLALRKRLGDRGIGLIEDGGYELISDKEAYCLPHLDSLNELLKPIFGEPVYALADQKIEGFGFNKNAVKHLVFNKFEGQIDTGKMMSSLITYTAGLGVRIMNSLMVANIEEHNGGVSVVAQSGHGETIRFRGAQVGVATNAFTKHLLPNLSIKPGRGLVLATQPIERLPFKGVFHIDEGYFYFRNFGNRVIFGGGRHLAMEEETTTEFGQNPALYQVLLDKLQHIILPNHPHEIDCVWSGIMAFGDVKKPIQESISERIHVGVRLGGMGVAIGSQVGQWLGQTMLHA